MTFHLAEVIDAVKPHLEMRFFLDKAKHLAAVIDSVNRYVDMTVFLDKTFHLLEEKKSDDHFFPGEQKCNRYAATLLTPSD